MGGTTWRYTRDPAPMRLTLVNGTPTFDKEGATGTRPGEFLAPSEKFQYAAAAE